MRQHFHSFDALRFFAFFKVFLLHLPLAAFPAFNYLKAGGGTGVLFFFVLSGFLITYILLVEKKQAGHINLRHFFLRRVLRIWPLYYLMLLFAFCTPWLLALLHLGSSQEGYSPNWLVSASFLENYHMILTNDHPNVSPLTVTWSLCIEEHFYILWGVLFYFLPLRRLPLIFVAGFLVALISRPIFLSRGWPTIDILTNLDFFVYGAVPAYLLVERPQVLKPIAEVPFALKLVLVALILAYVVISPNSSYRAQPYIEPVFLGLSFSFLLTMTLPKQNAIRIGDRSPLSRLGQYTYGLYLYHTIIINLLVHLWPAPLLDKPLPALGFGLLALGASIAVSILSYHFFEKIFLRWKPERKRPALETEATTAFGGEASRPKSC